MQNYLPIDVPGKPVDKFMEAWKVTMVYQVKSDIITSKCKSIRCVKTNTRECRFRNSPLLFEQEIRNQCTEVLATMLTEKHGVMPTNESPTVIEPATISANFTMLRFFWNIIKIQILINSGADISVLTIDYSQQNLITHQFSWIFVVADVFQSIFGSEFLANIRIDILKLKPMVESSRHTENDNVAFIETERQPLSSAKEIGRTLVEIRRKWIWQFVKT